MEATTQPGQRYPMDAMAERGGPKRVAGGVVTQLWTFGRHGCSLTRSARSLWFDFGLLQITWQ
jgi:hypothetical protein